MRTPLVLLTALVASLALPALGAAKGPASAILNGPGLGGTRHLTGDSEAGPGSPLGALTMAGGFFAQTFGETPDPTRAARPEGNLGPRYTVTYVVPGPSGGHSVLRQDFYPYARPAPLTYMKPGQTFWSGTRAHGGWFTAKQSLLRRLGLPAHPPATSGTHVWRWSGIGGGAAVVLAAAVGLLVLRLRPKAGPVSA